MQEQEYEMAIIVSNAHATDFTLVLEPWGRSYDMPPQVSYTVVFRSLVPPKPPDTVEVVYGTDQIAVYGWVGCLLAVYQNDEVLPPGAFVGPHIPAGISILKNLGVFKATLDAAPAKDTQEEEP